MELEKGKITMVIPLYNNVETIRTTLESVVNNHGKTPFECIIVDDASTDGSSEIAKEFENNYPDLFTYVKIQHRGIIGPPNARNFGIRLCNSEYICFLDADDELYEGHIDRSVEFLKKYDYFNIYGENYNYCGYNGMYCIPMDTDLSTIENIFLTGYGAGIGFWCFVFKTEQVKKILFENCPGDDGIFLFTMLHRYKPFYYNIKEIALAHHTERDKPTTTNIYESEYNYDIPQYIQKTIELNPDFPIDILYTDTKWELVKRYK